MTEWSQEQPITPGWYFFEGDARVPGADRANRLSLPGLVRVEAGRAARFISAEGKWDVAHLTGTWARTEAPPGQELADCSGKSDEELVVVLLQRKRERLDEGRRMTFGPGRADDRSRAADREEPSDFIE